MKKIAIFLSILFNIISSKEINLLITKQTYKIIISEVDTVATEIYNNLVKKVIINDESSNGKYFNYVMPVLHNKMVTTFTKLNIQHSDQSILELGNDLITIYREYYMPNMSEIINKFKTRIIRFLSIYGFIEEKNQLRTLDKEIENAIKNVVDKIFQNCKNIPIINGLENCIDGHFNLLYPFLSTDYITKIKQSNIFKEIAEIIFQQKDEIQTVKNIIIKKITNLLSYNILIDENTANRMESIFIEIKNECLKSIANTNIDCLSSRINSIYDLIPFQLLETSESIINTFMEKSEKNIDELVRIFLKLNIETPNNNRLRLLYSDFGNFATPICKWFVSLFYLDFELCYD